MSNGNYAKKQRKRAMNVIVGGCAVVLLPVVLIFVYCMFKVDTTKEIIGSGIMAAVSSSFLLLCVINFLPAKKRRAIVLEKGENTVGTEEGAPSAQWVDVKINKKIKRWYVEDDDELYTAIQRGKTYIFLLKRRTIVKTESANENKQKIKLLNWTWVGVAAALIIYFIMKSSGINALSSILGPVLQTWAIIFFACFGFSKCLKLPFRQKTLWISLASAAVYCIINELLTLFMLLLTGIILENGNQLLQVIEVILCYVISMALLVLAYMLTRLSREGKSAFTLKWNKWMFSAVIVTVIFATYRALVETFYVAMTISLMRKESNILMLAYFFSNDIISAVLTMICRGAVLFFVSAAALKGISHSPTKDVQEVKC